MIEREFDQCKAIPLGTARRRSTSAQTPAEQAHRQQQLARAGHRRPTSSTAAASSSSSAPPSPPSPAPRQRGNRLCAEARNDDRVLTSEVDLVLVAVGVRPNTDWRSRGRIRGAIDVDDHMRTRPGLYAAGLQRPRGAGQQVQARPLDGNNAARRPRGSPRTRIGSPVPGRCASAQPERLMPSRVASAHSPVSESSSTNCWLTPSIHSTRAVAHPPANARTARPAPTIRPATLFVRATAIRGNVGKPPGG